MSSNLQKRAGRPLTRVTPMIDVGEEGLGPAMLALSRAHRAFVTALVIHGLTQAAAAEAAGYSASSKASLEVQGSKLAHREDIQAAILELGCKVMRAEGPKSIRFLAEVRDSTWLETKDRLKAGIELLNRSGFVAVTQTNVNVEHTHKLSEAQMDARIIELCRELGLPEQEARKLLIAPDKIIEAEFSEVEPEPVAPEVIAKRERRNERARELDALLPDAREAAKAKTLADRAAAMKERRRLAEASRKINAQLENEPAQATAEEPLAEATDGEIEW